MQERVRRDEVLRRLLKVDYVFELGQRRALQCARHVRCRARGQRGSGRPGMRMLGRVRPIEALRQKRTDARSAETNHRVRLRRMRRRRPSGVVDCSKAHLDRKDAAPGDPNSLGDV